MSKWPQRACRALTVYLERGLRSLEELRAERYDEADALLNMRKAAFHNFRAADFMAMREGYSDEIVRELQELWRQIEQVDAELMTELVGARDKMEAALAQLAKVKVTLGRYHSNQQQVTRIEKSV